LEDGSVTPVKSVPDKLFEAANADALTHVSVRHCNAAVTIAWIINLRIVNSIVLALVCIFAERISALWDITEKSTAFFSYN